MRRGSPFKVTLCQRGLKRGNGQSAWHRAGFILALLSAYTSDPIYSTSSPSACPRRRKLREMRQTELDGCPARPERPEAPTTDAVLTPCLLVKYAYSTAQYQAEMKKKEVMTQTPAGVNKTKSSFTANTRKHTTTPIHSQSQVQLLHKNNKAATHYSDICGKVGFGKAHGYKGGSTGSRTVGRFMHVRVTAHGVSSRAPIVRRTVGTNIGHVDKG